MKRNYDLNYFGSQISDLLSKYYFPITWNGKKFSDETGNEYSEECICSMLDTQSIEKLNRYRIDTL